MDIPSFESLNGDPVCIADSEDEAMPAEPLATSICTGFTRDETLILGEHLKEQPPPDTAQALASAQEEALDESASATLLDVWLLEGWWLQLRV